MKKGKLISVVFLIIFSIFGCSVNRRSTNDPKDLMEAEKLISKFYFFVGEKRYSEASNLFSKNSYYDSLKLKTFAEKILKECGKQNSYIIVKNNSLTLNNETQGLLENNVYHEKQNTEEFFDFTRENKILLIKDYKSRIYKSLE